MQKTFTGMIALVLAAAATIFINYRLYDPPEEPNRAATVLIFVALFTALWGGLWLVLKNRGPKP